MDIELTFFHDTKNRKYYFTATKVDAPEYGKSIYCHKAVWRKLMSLAFKLCNNGNGYQMGFRSFVIYR